MNSIGIRVQHRDLSRVRSMNRVNLRGLSHGHTTNRVSPVDKNRVRRGRKRAPSRDLRQVRNMGRKGQSRSAITGLTSLRPRDITLDSG
jgi:hypothetical protein